MNASGVGSAMINSPRSLNPTSFPPAIISEPFRNSLSVHFTSPESTAMQRNPLLTEAMTRAFVFADASAAGEVDHVEKIIDSMFARAMSDGEPTEDQYHIARVISDVWLSNLLAWLTRRASATDVSKRLDLAVRLLIGAEDKPKI